MRQFHNTPSPLCSLAIHSDRLDEVSEADVVQCRFCQCSCIRCQWIFLLLLRTFCQSVTNKQINELSIYNCFMLFISPGFENMVKNKLIYPGAHGYVNDYNPGVDPSVLDEHATAAFRHFHTLIRGYLKYVLKLKMCIYFVFSLPG